MGVTDVASSARPRDGWPFARDAAVAARVAELQSSVGDRLVARILALAGSGDGAVLAASDVRSVVVEFGLASPRELSVLALPAAATLARPSISAYRVGAVGLATTGELVLGGNLEFPGASIHHTIHGEGFVTLRARALGLSLGALAISEARPCAHCRQLLAEMTWADGLRLVDPFGADVGMWDVYPAPFVPSDLGMEGAGAREEADDRPRGATVPTGLDDDLGVALTRAAGRAHAPYSGEPAAIVVRTGDGRLFDGAVLESVAFNPTIGPLQDALVGLAAAGVPFASIERAWLATVRAPRAGHEAPTRDLLAAVAPDASLEVTYWA